MVSKEQIVWLESENKVISLFKRFKIPYLIAGYKDVKEQRYRREILAKAK